MSTNAAATNHAIEGDGLATENTGSTSSWVADAAHVAWTPDQSRIGTDLHGANQSAVRLALVGSPGSLIDGQDRLATLGFPRADQFEFEDSAEAGVIKVRDGGRPNEVYPGGPELEGRSFDIRASTYGRGFHGRLTANGETYDMNGVERRVVNGQEVDVYTAASRTLPWNTIVAVEHNGVTKYFRINNDGPHHNQRTLDLSTAGHRALGSPSVLDQLNMTIVKWGDGVRHDSGKVDRNGDGGFRNVKRENELYKGKRGFSLYE